MLRYRKVLTMVMIDGNASWHHRCRDRSAGQCAGVKLMSGFLFASTPHDPLVLAGGCGLLLAVAMTATLVPAIRGTGIDPNAALRHE
jgi:hypothetical protein